MEFNELYQELILDHNKSPRNCGVIENPDRFARGNNPLCGDKIVVQVNLDGDQIADVRFDGSGCAISTASASLMTEAIKGRTIAEAEQLFSAFHSLVTGGEPPAIPLDLGKLEVFSGVSDYPARVKCASLAWHTLNAILKNDQEVVTTE